MQHQGKKTPRERRKKYIGSLGWCICARASISRRLQFEPEETVRISLRNTVLFSLLRSNFPRAAGGRKDTVTGFHNEAFRLKQKQVERSSSRLYCVLFVEWNFAVPSSKRKGEYQTFKFPWKLRSDIKTWEFVVIWRCLGNALSSSDLNCYSLYLQEFQLEAGILY